MFYTYRDLLAALQELTQEELEMSATVYDASADEYFPVTSTNKVLDGDVLQEGHPVLVFGEE